MLEFCQERGWLVEVCDPYGYWEQRDERKQLERAQNSLADLAAWTGAIKDALAGSHDVSSHEEITRYIRNHVHRMDYPSYLAHGWQIGSGPVEAACMTVIGQRLKECGMRWGDDGADALSHLRALYLSKSSQWNRFGESLNQSPQN